jgi:6,7-dimethyl-8-ribityllumazine synthase
MSNWKKQTPIKKLKENKFKVGIVTAHFNNNITDELLRGVLRQLKKIGVNDNRIQSVRVPGAVEVPLAASWLLQNGVDGVITLGCVIRGETPHFDYVCQSVERGCTMLQLEQSKPVVFGVLTTENLQQAQDRIGGRHGHKGEEAADTLIEMLSLKKMIFSKKTYNSKNKKGVSRAN